MNLALKTYHVYIMASFTRTLYVGLTSDLPRRMFQHKNKLFVGLTAKYNITNLVYAEESADVNEAIAREKQIKGWRREIKIALIELINPHRTDLVV